MGEKAEKMRQVLNSLQWKGWDPGTKAYEYFSNINNNKKTTSGPFSRSRLVEREGHASVCERQLTRVDVRHVCGA